jgi:hypothetical protein
LFSRIQVGDMKLEHFIEIFIVCFSPFTACTFSVSWDAYIWKLSFHYWTRLSSSFPVFFTIISKYNLCLWMQFLHSKSVFFLLFTFSLIVVLGSKYRCATHWKLKICLEYTNNHHFILHFVCFTHHQDSYVLILLCAEF